MPVELIQPLSRPIAREDIFRPEYKIETPYQFLDHFTKSAKTAEKRIWFRTMYFEADEVFRPVAAALKDGAERGLDSRLVVDYFTFMFTDGHINWMPTLNRAQAADLRRKQQAKIQLVNELRDAGVSVEITNVPGLKERIVPIRGRSHIKGGCVDDEAWGGGLNASAKDFARPDTMLYTNDPVAVDALNEQFDVDNTRREERVNKVIPISPATSLIIDGGIPGNSAILKEVYNYIDTTTDNVTVVSQFFPDKPMLNHLAEAQGNNVDARVITSDSRYIHEALARIYSRRTELISHLRRQPVPVTHVPFWVHIKAALGDLGTDHPWVSYGTHNYLELGANLGTEEVALFSRDPQIVREVSSAIGLLEQK